MPAPRDRLIVALDVPTIPAASALIERLGDAASFYKIGYQLAFAGGLALAETLVAAGKQVFLDLKLHDIGNTVEKGVESVARMGATFVTVHAYPQTMKAAVAARGGAGLRILAVTVLTSYDDADLDAAGYALGVSSLVARRAAQARGIGVDGLVCSAEEAAALRSLVGASMVLVTPGIRPAGAAAGDQKRVMTPARAIAAGADYLVVGRPIVEAADPRAAAQANVAEIAAAAAARNRRRASWRRDTGWHWSTCPTPRATSPMSPASRTCSASSAAVTSSAAAATR
jgi:orotidine-5'-phosphate decarboxylase